AGPARPRSGPAAGRSPEADRVSPPRARRAQLYLQHCARPGQARRAKRGARRVGGDRAPQAAQPPRSAADTLQLDEAPQGYFSDPGFEAEVVATTSFSCSKETRRCAKCF